MNTKEKYLFTSESVTEGHPDKVSDRISDSVLDAILKVDPNGRVACETLVTTGMVLIAGEITTKTYVDIPKIARAAIKDIGYDDPSQGFDYKTCAVITTIDEQSSDISQGVDDSDDHEQGAGDQGLMFGYACAECEEYMPLPILYAHKLTKRLADVRKQGVLDYLGPDGKSQVTVEYSFGVPKRVEAIVVASQHKAGITHEQIKADLIEHVIRPVVPADMIDEQTKFHVNETGSFVLGGPHADCGLTGRKIIVDTYGGNGSHGGGAFSGKDPSKVDRSASYAARWIAKNVVAAGLADQCEVQVAYAIGVAKPVSLNILTYGTNKVDDALIEKAVLKNFDLRPKAIIERLQLKRPIYAKTSAYGHFGRNDPDFTWEKLDMVDVLKRDAGL